MDMYFTMKERKKMLKKIAIFVLLVMVAMVMAFPIFALAEEIPVVDTPTVKAVIDLTFIVEAILALLATLITVKLIPYIKSKTTAAQQAKIQAAINTAVYAAEQLFGAGRGEEKLDWALKNLESQGIKIDSAAVRAGIEAAVKALNLTQDEIVARSIITIPDLQD